MQTSLDTKASYQKRGVNQERLKAVLENAGSSILDVGCGSGAYVLQLADQYRITGVDYQPFESWAERPELFAISDAATLDRPDESVDTILSFETLEHLPDPLKALQEYHRVCRKNVVLTVPNCEHTPAMKQSNLIYYHWIDRTHVHFFTLESIKQLALDAGFQNVKAYYINRLTLLPLVQEAFEVPGFLRRIIPRLFARFQKRPYYITCLVVAEK